jgi:cobalamin-dependent methionine synthase I
VSEEQTHTHTHTHTYTNTRKQREGARREGVRERERETERMREKSERQREGALEARLLPRTLQQILQKRTVEDFRAPLDLHICVCLVDLLEDRENIVAEIAEALGSSAQDNPQDQHAVLHPVVALCCSALERVHQRAFL